MDPNGSPSRHNSAGSRHRGNVAKKFHVPPIPRPTGKRNRNRQSRCRCSTCQTVLNDLFRENALLVCEPAVKRRRISESREVISVSSQMLLDICRTIVRREVDANQDRIADLQRVETVSQWNDLPLACSRPRLDVCPFGTEQGCSDAVPVVDSCTECTVAISPISSSSNLKSKSVAFKPDTCSVSKALSEDASLLRTSPEVESSASLKCSIIPESSSSATCESTCTNVESAEKSDGGPLQSSSSSSSLMPWMKSVGYNVCNAAMPDSSCGGLRPICIDGSNVAFSHSKGRYFSARGLEICVNYFLNRGHRVYTFVPLFRKSRGQTDSPGVLKRLERAGHMVFTPSRVVDNTVRTSYDDRYIVQCAMATGGVIVSMDNYRDLIAENSDWEQTIKERLLMFTWIDDMLFFPLDPVGRDGPSLEEFLTF